MTCESSQCSKESQLPNTQDSAGIDFSQDVLDEGWGMLCSTKRSYRTLVMTKNEYTVGRNHTCDVVFVVEGHDSLNNVSSNNKIIVPVPDKKIGTISKMHFKIKNNSSVVYLEDCSSNGTYVNTVLVGKHQKVILQNNDEIRIAHPNYKYFVYMERKPFISTETLAIYPAELKDNYVVSRSLGTGSYGEVNLVFQKRSFEKYAMKVVQKKKFLPNQNMLNEVDILKALNHPNVIKIHNVITSPKCLFIFLGYMEGGDLYQKIDLHGKLSEALTKWIFYQLARGVEYLHEEGIAHRDLKPENILLSSEEDFPIIKIADFGLSKFFNSVSVMKTLCGTQTYVAPEILETQGKGMYSNQVDVWSLGVILYVCLSGSLPFKLDRKDMNIVEQIMSGSYSFSSPIWKDVTAAAISLISRMMTVNPKMRITVKMVKTHPWFQDAELLKRLRVLKIPKVGGNENEPPKKRARLGL